MVAEYGYIGLFLVVAIVFAATFPLLALSLRLIGWAPKRPNPIKNSTYECGMETVGKSWVQFNFRYYLYALVFVVFDVLVVFLYPWATAFKELSWAGLIAMLVVILILVVGYIYAWKKRALEWK